VCLKLSLGDSDQRDVVGTGMDDSIGAGHAEQSVGGIEQRGGCENHPWHSLNELGNDARGIAQTMRLGWFRAVHVKNVEMQAGHRAGAKVTQRLKLKSAQ
jgi:hypothetical protein